MLDLCELFAVGADLSQESDVDRHVKLFDSLLRRDEVKVALNIRSAQDTPLDFIKLWMTLPPF